MAEAGANVALWYNSNKKAIEKAEGLEKQYGIKAKAYQCGGEFCPSFLCSFMLGVTIPLSREMPTSVYG